MQTNNTPNYTAKDVEARRRIIRKMIEGAFSIRGYIIRGDELNNHIGHWEAALIRIATPQLLEVYELGMEKGCETVAQFKTLWLMKVQAESARMETKYQRKRNAEKFNNATETAPAFIQESWGMEMVQ